LISVTITITQKGREDDMKVRTDCNKCRERIYKEAETDFLKHEYKFFSDSAYSLAVFATAAALCVHHRRKRSKKYIQQFFDEMCFIFDYPEIMGKQITTTEMVKFLTEAYGIDFSKIKLHLESEEEFIRDVR